MEGPEDGECYVCCAILRIFAHDSKHLTLLTVCSVFGISIAYVCARINTCTHIDVLEK